MANLSSPVKSAIDAAARSDRETFASAVNELADSGWDDVQMEIAEAFVQEVENIVGSSPTVNDLILVAQAVFPQTREFLNASVYDLEFLLRGFFGASQMMSEIPRNVALIMQLAMLGTFPRLVPIELHNLARDTY